MAYNGTRSGVRAVPANTGRQSKRVALCGVLCALSVAILMLGNAIGIGTYAAPMLACFLLIPAGEEYGPKTALLLYAGTAALAVLLLPDKELALFYALVLGYYPVLRTALARVRPAALRWALKFGCFNAATLAMYALLLTLFASPALLEEFADTGPVLLAALLGVGNMAFLFLDIALGLFTRVYHARLRRHIRRFL